MRKTPWLIVGVANLLLGGVFAIAVVSPPAQIKTLLLPGKTSHGHYQIEMKCDACHGSEFTTMQDACLKCHQAELKLAKDTHPSSKFNDPTNAERLSLIDAQKCVTCHEEHRDGRTGPMGVTVPIDYCFYCHQETYKSRPSHAEFSFDSCATAGCHNYHDNTALYEAFLWKHADEPDQLPSPTLIRRARQFSALAVSGSTADAPEESLDDKIVHDWSVTTHAMAGVNCRKCHGASTLPADTGAEQILETWSDAVTHETCRTCHELETTTFLQGKHGFRLAEGLPPMMPADARLTMHKAALHRQLT
ncbi:MAG: cytochrome c3 family protein, partial [Planctomycetales bacterium]|nr:cytochrome c3 family protein [Planctomycetales bacterium]